MEIISKCSTSNHVLYDRFIRAADILQFNYGYHNLISSKISRSC